MYNDWINLVPKLVDNLNEIEQLTCPNCGEHKIDYLYIGNEENRMGYLQLWCSHCLKGIYVSRAKAPEGARMVTFEQTDERDKIIPAYTFINN